MRLAIEYSETQTKIYQKIKVLPFERQDFYFLIFIGINGYKRRRGGTAVVATCHGLSICPGGTENDKVASACLWESLLCPKSV